jgi:hypothetical protein
MFTSNIGRGRFFAYSALMQLAEVVAVVLCISMTTGFAGLIESKPGPGREGVAGAILAASMILVAVRGNFAWRRTRDAGKSYWIFGVYVVFSALFAVLQAAQFLVYKFDGDNSNSGIGLMGLGIVSLWSVILSAKSSGDAPSNPLASGGKTSRWGRDREAPQSGLALLSDAELVARARALKEAEISRASNTSAVRHSSTTSSNRGGGFGKRGVA